MADRQAAFLRQLREAYSSGEMLAEQLCRTAFLPRPQAADRRHGRFSQSRIFLQKMSPEDQSEMVLGQRAWLPNMGKEALGQLGDDEILFIERETEGVHRANP